MRSLSDCVKLPLPVLALVALLSIGGAAPVTADGFAAEPISVAIRVPKAAKIRYNNYDWLAKRSPRATVQRVRFVADRADMPRQIGTGSYICSPAGFGKRSKCYAN